MTEWDKLWKDIPKPFYKELMKYGYYFEAGSVERFFEQVKAGGGKMQDNLEVIRGIAFDPENEDDPYVGEARALKKIRELLGDD